jgi:hypothetical protein
MSEGDRLWRFPVVVFPTLDGNTRYHWENPVKVTSGGNLVGFASLDIPPGHTHPRILAYVAVKYDIPERLDVENGVPIYLLPFAEVFLMRSEGDRSIVSITELQFRHDCDNPEVEPISSVVL